MPWLAVTEKNLPQFTKGDKIEVSEVDLHEVLAGRKLGPTTLGITLIRGYQCIDPDLCLPDIHSFIEQQITLVAKGQADHFRVVQHVLQQFRQKYSCFVKQHNSLLAPTQDEFSVNVANVYDGAQVRKENAESLEKNILSLSHAQAVQYNITVGNRIFPVYVIQI
ncbi:unnamed protein product [Prunus armeniaca]